MYWRISISWGTWKDIFCFFYLSSCISLIVLYMFIFLQPTTPGSSKKRLSNISNASSEDSNYHDSDSLTGRQSAFKNRPRANTVAHINFNKAGGCRLPVCNEIDGLVTSVNDRRPSLPDFLMRPRENSPSIIRKGGFANKSPRGSSVRFQTWR